MVHESEKCTTCVPQNGAKKPRFRPIFRGCGTVLVHKSQSVVHLFRGVPQAKLSFFITLIESFLDMASVPTIRVIFDRRKTATAVKKASVEIEVYYNRERTRIPTGVSVLKHIRLKRQTYETYLHIITSHLVSVKIW